MKRNVLGRPATRQAPQGRGTLHRCRDIGRARGRRAAAERLKAKLAEAALSDPAVELIFTLPDAWSVRLFTALCRRYGFKPYRYPRQRRTTVMVKVPRRAFDEMVWRQFVELHAEMQRYFEETTEALIRNAVYPDTADAETVAEPVSRVS